MVVWTSKTIEHSRSSLDISLVYVYVHNRCALVSYTKWGNRLSHPSFHPAFTRLTNLNWRMSNINSFFCACARSDVRDRAEENNYKPIVNKSNKWNHNLFIIYSFVSPYHSSHIIFQCRSNGAHTQTHTSNVCKSIHGWTAETSTIWIWRCAKATYN